MENIASKARRPSGDECRRSARDCKVPPESEKIRWSDLRWMKPYIREHWRLGAVGAAGIVLLALLALPAPYLMKVAIDRAIVGQNYVLLNRIILLLLGIQALLVAISWVTNYSFNRFSLEIMTHIKKDLFHRILRYPMSFFAAHETGYIMSRVTEVEGLNIFFFKGHPHSPQ